ncbi:hypothetical protein WOLCODRAFT_152235 [Wolfiporia cocos MD-104 SS10]|uniref:Uncharacterized protein n=1 Tax=Wolfiporia cocos (strain MD-104) TaxID=742152 RepID=A0A2H3JTH5_WOLCO|nr:hypothetical protein WOLCODRAFT_152235 [Wolfiporia cocos MD-104 SS10]
MCPREHIQVESAFSMRRTRLGPRTSGASMRAHGPRTQRARGRGTYLRRRPTPARVRRAGVSAGRVDGQRAVGRRQAGPLAEFANGKQIRIEQDQRCAEHAHATHSTQRADHARCQSSDRADLESYRNRSALIPALQHPRSNERHLLTRRACVTNWRIVNLLHSSDETQQPPQSAFLLIEFTAPTPRITKPDDVRDLSYNSPSRCP